MLKILTLNLNLYGQKYGPWERRRQIVCDVLESAQPEIVALQAVRQEPHAFDGLDQASQLAGLLPAYRNVIFRPAMHTPDGGQEGSAILSRLPIAAADVLPLTLLPGLDDTNQRAVIHARFDLPAGPLHLFNAHLSWVDTQTDESLNELLPYLGRFEGLALLLGDLNTPSNSPLLERFRQAGLTDLWQKLQPDQPGFTFESGNPSLRIDYLWANAGLAERARSIEIVANQPDEAGRRASDHFGLLAGFDL